MNAAQTILKSISNAINPPPTSTLHVLAGKFAKSYGGEIISPADLKKLKAFEAAWREAWRDRNERFTPVAAKNEFQRQITSEEPAKPDGLQTIVWEYETRSIRAQSLMRQINEDSLPLVKTALQGFISAGEIWIDQRVKDEKAEAAECGVAFSPSNILLASQRLLAAYKIKLTNLSPSQCNPLGHLAFLSID